MEFKRLDLPFCLTNMLGNNAEMCWFEQLPISDSIKEELREYVSAEEKVEETRHSISE